MTYRIFLAVRNQLFGEGLAALLEKQKDFCLVGMALTSEKAIQKAKKIKPDLLILDSLLLGAESNVFLRHFQVCLPRMPILWLADDPDPGFAAVILGLGVKGYVLKDCGSNELTQAIRVLIAHGIFLCASVESVMLENVARPGTTQANGNIHRSDLTSCEQRVMVLLVEGKSNKDIADFLGVSIKTVHAHRTQLMRKLQLHSLPALTKYAIQQGIISLK